MASCARNEVVVEGEVSVYHIWSRCVRRSFLCGADPLTGKDYEYRRDWIHAFLKQLAALFGVEVGFHAELTLQQGLDVDLPSLNRTESPRRASEKGLLSVGLDDYLAMPDWTGDKCGVTSLVRFLHTWLRFSTGLGSTIGCGPT